MPTVAEVLRNAREAQGLDLSRAADITKIRADHLAALEEGNYNVFPAPVYIKGFTRTYAGLLKLDVPSTLQLLEKELSQTRRFREPPRLSGDSRGVLDFITLWMSRVNWRIALPVVLIVVVAVVSVLAWQEVQKRKRENPLKNLGPGLYQPGKAATPGALAIPPTNAPARTPTTRRNP